MKRFLFRVLLVVIFPLVPFIMPFFVLWEARWAFTDGIREFYRLWPEAFRKGGRLTP